MENSGCDGSRNFAFVRYGSLPPGTHTYTHVVPDTISTRRRFSCRLKVGVGDNDTVPKSNITG